MEDATRAGEFSLPKTKLLRSAVLILFTFVICRGPLMEGCFPAAISFIAYMLSRSAMNLYLVFPAAAGIVLYIPKGYEPWGDIAAMCVCGLLFAAARRIKLSMWQRAIIAAAIGIICMSIYRLATGSVYKMSVETLLLESLVIFVLVFVFEAFFFAMEKSAQRAAEGGKELLPVSFVAVCLMALNGMGLSFLVWLLLLFIGLWFLMYMDLGTALMVSAAGGAVAALMGQGQWGLMATMMMGLTAAAFAKKYGTLPAVAVFIAVCRGLGAVESGIVLGVDGYSLFLSSAIFLVLHWKFGVKMAKAPYLFAGKENQWESAGMNDAEHVLHEKIAQVNDLAELYATYLDSRSALADQFSITGQILEDAEWRLSRNGRKAIRYIHEKFQVKVAISQCAATGAINGDCCGWQEIGGGRVALVVSDGMGKGKKAAAESLMVTKTIMSLLKAGATVDIALKMINTIMLTKEDEDSYATVDLTVIDKYTAKAKFYKIGAAPTLIRRKDNVEEVKLSAVPLGVVNGLKIRYVETTLKKDDWIIMMSDGVSDGGKTGAGSGREFLHRIREAAADVRSQDPQTMSDLLLNQAADSYIGRERDDMTVMVAKVV